jgi:hypothetical protein
MSQRITDASAKVARSFYLLPRMTDNVLFGLSRTMTGLSGEVVQHLNVLKSFSSCSGRQHAEQPLAAVHEAGYGTKLPADYPIFLGYSGREMLAVRLSHFDPLLP